MKLLTPPSEASIKEHSEINYPTFAKTVVAVTAIATLPAGKESIVTVSTVLMVSRKLFP